MVLTGYRICQLMRKHKKTIRGIKAEFGITLKRIREVRKKGATGFMAKDWFRIICGYWPDLPKPQELPHGF